MGQPRVGGVAETPKWQWERMKRCWNDSLEGMYDMVLLGLCDVMVSTKYSSFTYMSKALAYTSGNQFCDVARHGKDVTFDCVIRGGDGKPVIKEGLAAFPYTATGLAQRIDRRLAGSRRGL